MCNLQVWSGVDCVHHDQSACMLQETQSVANSIGAAEVDSSAGKSEARAHNKQNSNDSEVMIKAALSTWFVSLLYSMLLVF